MEKAKNKLLSFFKALSIIGGIFMMIISNVVNFYELPFMIDDWRIALGIGLFLFIFGTLWILYDLYRKYVWWSKPKVSLEILRKEVFEVDKSPFVMAQIKVENKEEREISDCYATIESITEIFQSDGKDVQITRLPLLIYGKDRIKWDETKYSNKNCKIIIPPEDCRFLNLADTENHRIKFDLCKSIVNPNWFGSEILCAFEIRIDGKFNGKSMKPCILKGFVYSETIRHDVQIDNSKEKYPIDIQNLWGEEGNWMKSKKLKEKRETKKEELLTQEGFFKALDKAILTIKKPKSPEKEKKKTSE